MNETNKHKALRENQPTEVLLARRYAQKAQHALKGGHEFTITFDEFRRLAAHKFCALSTIPFRKYVKGLPADGNHELTFNSWTLDRLDNKQGYIPGNCLAVCHGVNQMKSMWEDPKNPISMPLVAKVITETKKRMGAGATIVKKPTPVVKKTPSMVLELSTTQCAKLLKCTPHYLRAEIHAGTLSVRVGISRRGGKKFFINKDDFLDWVELRYGGVHRGQLAYTLRQTYPI